MGYDYDLDFETPLNRSSFQFLEKEAEKLTEKYPYEQLAKEMDLETINSSLWQQESYFLAKNFAYLNGDLIFNETLDFSYLESLRNITYKRVVIAGYRLANTLQQLFQDLPDSNFVDPQRSLPFFTVALLVFFSFFVASLLSGFVVYFYMKRKLKIYEEY